jgi:hypothetical protein
VKTCPIDKYFAAFDNKAEILDAFRKLADVRGKPLSSWLNVSRDRSLDFYAVESLIRCFGVKNVYFEVTFSEGYIDAMYINLKDAAYTAETPTLAPAEMSVKQDGWLRLWFCGREG